MSEPTKIGDDERLETLRDWMLKVNMHLRSEGVIDGCEYLELRDLTLEAADWNEASGRACEEFLCQESATHVFHDDMGVNTDVCDEHAREYPEEMLEVITEEL